MRVMMKVSIPVESGNKGIKDGSLPKAMMTFLEVHKPESAYFTHDHGQRTAFFVLEAKDSTLMPTLAEPFYTAFNATVDMRPVMNAAELKAGLEKLPK